MIEPVEIKEFKSKNSGYIVLKMFSYSGKKVIEAFKNEKDMLSNGSDPFYVKAGSKYIRFQFPINDVANFVKASNQCIWKNPDFYKN